MTAARPFRDVKLGSREVVVERGAGGVVYVRLAQALGEYPARMTDKLDYWAEHTPDRTYIAKRDAGGEWKRISYREAREMGRRDWAGAGESRAVGGAADRDCFG